MWGRIERCDRGNWKLITIRNNFTYFQRSEQQRLHIVFLFRKFRYVISETKRVPVRTSEHNEGSPVTLLPWATGHELMNGSGLIKAYFSAIMGSNSRCALTFRYHREERKLLQPTHKWLGLYPRLDVNIREEGPRDFMFAQLGGEDTQTKHEREARGSVWHHLSAAFE